MTTSQSGSYWLCPGCRRHVPSRIEACRCGFSRASADMPVEQPRRPPQFAVRQTQQTSGSWISWVLWAIVAGSALAGSIYLSLRIKPKDPADSELARRMRQSREREVTYVAEPPPPRPPIAVQPRGRIVAPPTQAAEPRAAAMVTGSRAQEEQNQRAQADAIYRPKVTAAAPSARRLRDNLTRYETYCAAGQQRGGASSRTPTADPRTMRWQGSESWARRRVSVVQNNQGDSEQCRVWIIDIVNDFEQVGTLMDEAEREATAEGIPAHVQRTVVVALTESLWL